MASRTTLLWRHTAAQLHALERVQREIHATDPHLRRKYLRDFNSAFRTYDATLTPAEFDGICLSADVLLVGDYHSLPASQNFAAGLLRRLSQAGRKVVLGVEFVFAHDQSTLDDWFTGHIDSAQLRRRIRFDSDWGYGWRPFHRLLQAGRDFAQRIVALDCMPRNDLSRIAARDRHAAARLAFIRQLHPDAVILALFGESHLAPKHLPELLRGRRPGDRILTVLQNIDPLYWHVTAASPARSCAVRVSSDVVCVFNSTPLQKYESYHSCIQRWRQSGCPTFRRFAKPGAPGSRS
jgi:hypothetical protein